MAISSLCSIYSIWCCAINSMLRSCAGALYSRMIQQTCLYVDSSLACHISDHAQVRVGLCAVAFRSIGSYAVSCVASFAIVQETDYRKVGCQHAVKSLADDTRYRSSGRTELIVKTDLSIIPKAMTTQLSLQPTPTHRARLACMTRKTTAAQNTTSRAFRIQ